jgi:hypothetical protein
MKAIFEACVAMTQYDTLGNCCACPIWSAAQGQDARQFVAMVVRETYRF